MHAMRMCCAALISRPLRPLHPHSPSFTFRASLDLVPLRGSHYVGVVAWQLDAQHERLLQIDSVMRGIKVPDLGDPNPCAPGRPSSASSALSLSYSLTAGGAPCSTSAPTL
eukprot:1536728-Prymnesium_polylepis.1